MAPVKHHRIRGDSTKTKANGIFYLLFCFQWLNMNRTLFTICSKKSTSVCVCVSVIFLILSGVFPLFPAFVLYFSLFVFCKEFWNFKLCLNTRTKHQRLNEIYAAAVAVAPALALLFCFLQWLFKVYCTILESSMIYIFSVLSFQSQINSLKWMRKLVN